MPPVLLPVTLTAAGGLALINFWLAMRIGSVRRAARVFVGDGGHEPLVRRMRAQANFVEIAPITLILIGLVELATGSSTWLGIVAALFLVGRVVHGIGMDGWLPGRAIGTAISMTAMVGLGLYAITLPLLGASRAAMPVTASVIPARR